MGKIVKKAKNNWIFGTSEKKNLQASSWKRRWKTAFQAVSIIQKILYISALSFGRIFVLDKSCPLVAKKNTVIFDIIFFENLLIFVETAASLAPETLSRIAI